MKNVCCIVFEFRNKTSCLDHFAVYFLVKGMNISCIYRVVFDGGGVVLYLIPT